MLAAAVSLYITAAIVTGIAKTFVSDAFMYLLHEWSFILEDKTLADCIL